MLLEQFDLHRQHFERTKNPVFAWQCIGLCFELNLEFPDWVLTYLKSSTAAVLSVDKKAKKGKKEKNSSAREAERIGRAFGFGRPKGKTGSFEEAYLGFTDEVLCKAVQRQLEAGEKPYRAYEIVAEQHGFASSTVRRAYLRFASPK